MLYQNLIKTKHVNPGQLLPPVFPLVLYNGSQRWDAAQNIRDLIAPFSGVERYRPSLEYLLIDEKDYSRTDGVTISLMLPLCGYYREVKRVGNSIDIDRLFHLSRERIQDLGEVFTPESYVNGMLALIS